ncbi:hypothetical protein [Luteibacter yeojuensis]|uniref:hypothetical protein n=1 Tax=Luteibacter yeojuensis TaxID=345309 RepID=UPI0012EE6E98|nr:hypothetical protein [Luteibacter yeojuensis]
MNVGTIVSAALGIALSGAATGTDAYTPLARAEVVTVANVAQSGEESTHLGFEYKNISSFVEFRCRLLGDGWSPVPNPDCREAVVGDGYESLCRKSPQRISCRVCSVVPEIFRSTGDGYSLMRYVKNGTPLSVTVYGDINDIDVPGQYGLDVIGWSYDESLQLMLIGEGGAP